jgi:uncharacterized SAM-binding protein YcdF (DUF218 family)
MDELYSISKTVLYPELWIFLALTIGSFLSWITRTPFSARFTLCLLTVLYYGFTTRPLADALVQPLETYHRPPTTTPVDQDAIVLFVNDQLALSPFTERATVVGTRNADLLICGLPYARFGNAPTLVLAEGALGAFPRRRTTATADLKQWAIFLGYPEKAIITSTEGIATHERARAIKRLLGSDKNILLVDEAIHLRRSAAAFQKVGFTVTPVPCTTRQLIHGVSPTLFRKLATSRPLTRRSMNMWGFSHTGCEG